MFGQYVTVIPVVGGQIQQFSKQTRTIILLFMSRLFPKHTFGFNLLWPLFVVSSELANVPPVKKTDELKTN